MVSSSKYTAPKEDGTFVMKIPTKTDDAPDPAHDQKIDLSQMDEQDIKSLRKSDPFMYYSIPEVLEAYLNFEDVDYSDITSRSRSHADSDPSSSGPSQQQQEHEAAVEDDASKVSRRTRVSFERHTSVLMEDMLDDLDQEFGDELLDLDDIISGLRRRSSSKRQ